MSPSQPPRHSGPTAPEGEVKVLAAAAAGDEAETSAKATAGVESVVLARAIAGVEVVVPAAATAGGNTAVPAPAGARSLPELCRVPGCPFTASLRSCLHFAEEDLWDEREDS